MINNRFATQMKDKHTEESSFQLQSKLHKLVQEMFSHYVGSKVIRWKCRLARDTYVFGYSIVNRLEAIELRSCLKKTGRMCVIGPKARPMLAALAWNYQPRLHPKKHVATDVVCSRKRKCWVLRTRSNRSRLHAHIPELMQWVITFS